MKYIRTYELFDWFKKKPKFKIGDYVVLEDHEIYGNLKPVGGKNFWHNYYGVIVDKGNYTLTNKPIDIFLIKILNKLSNEEIEKLRNIFKSREYIENTTSEISKEYAPKGYLWINPINLKSFNSKDQWQEYVDEIEMKKTANIYNL